MAERRRCRASSARSCRCRAHFEQAAKLVTRSTVAEQIVCGPDAERHVDAIQEFVDAGYDHVYVHQVGPDQEGFFRFYEREVMPRFSESEAPATPRATPRPTRRDARGVTARRSGRPRRARS